jgi:hypothetical protein
MKRFLSILLLLAVALSACQPAVTDTPAPAVATQPPAEPSATAPAAPSPTATETSSPLTAVLSEIRGDVLLKNPTDADFVPASDGDIFLVGGQVQTGETGFVRLDLSSGTRIRLAPSSAFTFVSNEASTNGDGGLITKVSVAFGKLWIILSGGELNVETPSGQASVRGSYMKVWVDPETKNTFITCLEGNCRAGNGAGAFNFIAGQTAFITFGNNANPPALGTMSQEDFDEWLQNNPEATLMIPVVTLTQSALATPTFTATLTPTRTLLPPWTQTFTPEPPPANTATPKPTNTPGTPTAAPYLYITNFYYSPNISTWEYTFFIDSYVSSHPPTDAWLQYDVYDSSSMLIYSSSWLPMSYNISQWQLMLDFSGYSGGDTVQYSMKLYNSAGVMDSVSGSLLVADW